MRTATFAVIAAAIACAGLPQPDRRLPPEISNTASIPGFDTRTYPGDQTMLMWRRESPYRWVGFYLPAPCYTGTSWVGKRAVLQAQNWGMAMIFVGEQDWRAMGRTDTAGVATQNPRCTAANLTTENARAHAQAAEAAAFEENFMGGSIIFLDVERVDSVSTALADYVRTWSAGLIRRGRYLPALYAHERNASELLSPVNEAYRDAGRSDRAVLWVAKQGGFTPTSRPEDAGVPGAAIWQGAFNERETWGGITLTIDVNVASQTVPGLRR